jgi:hypothetical protein
VNKPHKHAKVIKAWADGAKIQIKMPKGSIWQDISDPCWGEGFEYRVKPESRRLYVRVARHKDGSLIAYSAPDKKSPHLEDSRWSTVDSLQWVNDDVTLVWEEK